MAKSNQYPSIEQVRELPMLNSEVVDDQWEDNNGHINVTYYMDFYNRSGWSMFAALGIDEDYFDKKRMGIVDLENYIRYFRELHVGNKVSLYCRYLAYDQKRFHGMTILTNDDTEEVACTFEFLTLSVDLTIRKSAPWPEHVIKHLETEVHASKQLGWHYPNAMSLQRKN